MSVLKQISLATALALSLGPALPARGTPGASEMGMAYEAEEMTVVGGLRLGPPPVAADRTAIVTNEVAAEASGRRCVRLDAPGQGIEFRPVAAANAMVIRYCVPDTPDGIGTDYTLGLYLNGVFLRKLSLTSRFSWLYGAYPFSNTPSQGQPRCFFDEVRVPNLALATNDLIRLQIDAGDNAPYYIIDLVELEAVPPALTRPPGSLSVTDYGAKGDGTHDDTASIQACLAAGGTTWMPTGTYLVTGDLAIPPNTTLQGAGMWYTTLAGSPATYTNSSRRVRLLGTGSGIHLSDFALLGRLNYRNDNEPNDGLGEVFGSGSTISRLWIEHTKAGAWIANSQGLVIDSCRIRNTLADGINLCVGVQGATVTNCATRNTGDDGFAMWPATYTGATYEHGSNLFTHCTAQLPYLANGAAIYGGRDNRIEECVIRDTPTGCGLLLAGTFPVGAGTFTGTTRLQRCLLERCGGYDAGWQWRGALTLCPQDLTISNVSVSDITLSNCLSYGLMIESPGPGLLSQARLANVTVSGYGTAVRPYHAPAPTPAYSVDGIFGMLARYDAKGSLTVSNLWINGAPIGSLLPASPDAANQSGGAFSLLFLSVASCRGTVISLLSRTVPLLWMSRYAPPESDSVPGEIDRYRRFL